MNPNGFISSTVLDHALHLFFCSTVPTDPGLIGNVEVLADFLKKEVYVEVSLFLGSGEIRG